MGVLSDDEAGGIEAEALLEARAGGPLFGSAACIFLDFNGVLIGFLRAALLPLLSSDVPFGLEDEGW